MTESSCLAVCLSVKPHRLVAFMVTTLYVNLFSPIFAYAPILYVQKDKLLSSCFQSFCHDLHVVLYVYIRQLYICLQCCSGNFLPLQHMACVTYWLPLDNAYHSNIKIVSECHCEFRFQLHTAQCFAVPSYRY